MCMCACVQVFFSCGGVLAQSVLYLHNDFDEVQSGARARRCPNKNVWPPLPPPTCPSTTRALCGARFTACSAYPAASSSVVFFVSPHPLVHSATRPRFAANHRHHAGRRWCVPPLRVASSIFSPRRSFRRRRLFFFFHYFRRPPTSCVSPFVSLRSAFLHHAGTHTRVHTSTLCRTHMHALQYIFSSFFFLYVKNERRRTPWRGFSVIAVDG